MESPLTLCPLFPTYARQPPHLLLLQQYPSLFLGSVSGLRLLRKSISPYQIL